MTESAEILELVTLPRDLKAAAATLGPQEARYLVDTYYQVQEFRKATGNQNRALSESAEPHDTITFFANQFTMIEKQIKGALDVYSAADPLAQWARSQVGIGPVIAAGLLAHIDIRKAPTVGHIWRFAGLDPTIRWGKGEKRPFNASLKVLCWKIGDSFVKFSGRDDCFYGRIYRERKKYELDRDATVYEVDTALVKGAMSDPNQGAYIVRDGEQISAYLIEGKWYCGGHAKACYETLATRNIRDKETRAVYESGHLPAGRLDLRARRYAVKLFLAHYHETGYKLHYKKDPPAPYPIAQLGHTHKIEVPA